MRLAHFFSRRLAPAFHFEPSRSWVRNLSYSVIVVSRGGCTSSNRDAKEIAARFDLTLRSAASTLTSACALRRGSSFSFWSVSQF
jgi:hypothetical protein